MQKNLKKLFRTYLKFRKINRVWFGKNKGFKYKYYEDYNLDMMLGIHEPNSFEVFKLFIKKGMVVTDIGSNFGYFTRFFSQQVGPLGKVYAFEPIPETHKMLFDTIKLNNLKNVFPIQAAVSDTDGSIKMYLSHTHYMASLDSKWASENGGTVNVHSMTLDAFFERGGIYPDFIKMDIEGGGVKALKGMVKCIKVNEPVLFLESHTAEEDLAIGKALSLIPYDVYRVGSNIPVKHLNKDYTDPHGIYGTVVAVPKSKKHLFPDWNPSIFQKKRLGQRG